MIFCLFWLVSYEGESVNAPAPVLSILKQGLYLLKFTFPRFLASNMNIKIQYNLEREGLY